MQNLMNENPDATDVEKAAANVACDFDGGTAGRSVAEVVESLRTRCGRGWCTAEVDATALADLIEALATRGMLGGR
jgi:hypothetical protein